MATHTKCLILVLQLKEFETFNHICAIIIKPFDIRRHSLRYFRSTNASSWGQAQRPEPTMNETCCAYNLAKLTKDLNCFNPDDARYMDYYERVLYNQIVGSVNPRKYQTCYQYAVGLDASKPWGNETPQATCCGGTGVENHVKYQEAAYFVSSPSMGGGQGEACLWVALYLPTTAHWEEQGVTLKQECQWPAEKTTIRIIPDKTSKSNFSLFT